ncbi:MAG TPA: methyl-accepting chemotaxis protein, partial [Bacillota bacterium]|nr:methyl-accepting chemotaxis protein [Bacillota bacterium]
MLQRVAFSIKNVINLFFSFFSKLKVFYQILIVIIVMLVFLIGEGLMGINNISEMQRKNQQIVSKGVNGMDSLFNYKIAVERLKGVYGEALARGHRGAVSFTMAELTPQLDNLEADDASKHSMMENVNQINRIMQEPISAQNWEKIDNLLLKNNMLIQNMDSAARYQIATTVELGTEFADRAKTFTFFMVILSLTLSLLLGMIITNSVSKPLNVVVEAARLLAKGDLTKNVNAKGCLEAVQVITSLQEAIIGLRKLVFGVHEHSQMLYIAGKELNSAANETGKSAVEVARAMEELAKASTEQSDEIIQTVVNVHELASLVRKVSSDTSDIALSSGKIADSA